LKKKLKTHIRAAAICDK